MKTLVSPKLGPFVLVLAALTLGALLPAGAAAAPPPEGNGTLTATPSPIVLPATTAGYQSAAQTVTLRYEGEGEVSIKGVGIEGGESGEFFINGSNCNTLSDGQTCEAWIGLKPSTVGAKQSYLVVQFFERPVASFEIGGEAVAPQLSFEPGSFDFGLQRANRESVSTTFAVKNSGAAGVQVNNYELTGPGHESFGFGNGDCSGRWLEPGESCSIQIWFYPRERTTYEAELLVWVNGASFGAAVRGQGGGAVIEALENPVDFGTATAGAAGTVRTVTLRNVGDMPEMFFIGVLAGGDAASFRLLGENCTLISLSPGGSCTARVLFAPDSAGAKVARLAFFGDGEGGTLVQLEGEAVEAAATLLPTGFDFGKVAAGSRSAAHTFVLRNDGGAPIALDRVVLAGADVDQFAISGDECTGATLAPGETCPVRVRFAPDSAGAKRATLRVSGPSATLSAALAGTAARAGGPSPGSHPHRGRHTRFVHRKTIDARKARFLHRKVHRAAHRR